MTVKKTTKKKSNAGRHTKIVDAVVRILTDAFKDDLTVEEACSVAGISKQTFYVACKKSPEFRDAMKRAQHYPLIAAKSRLLRAINAPGPEAGTLSLKFLERRQKARYSPKVEHKHEGTIATYAQLEGKAKTPEEAVRMAEEAELDEEDEEE